MKQILIKFWKSAYCEWITTVAGLASGLFTVMTPWMMSGVITPEQWRNAGIYVVLGLLMKDGVHKTPSSDIPDSTTTVQTTEAVSITKTSPVIEGPVLPQ
jgi:hypothetical protein